MSISNKAIVFFRNNIVFLLIIAALLYWRLPGIISMYQVEGEPAAKATIFSLAGQPAEMPFSRKHVLVFWATWCGPCKVELGRLNKLIQAGAIASGSVIAVSSGESSATVAKAVKERGYQFQVMLDPTGEAASAYGVSGAPTIVFVTSEGAMDWVTMGISPSLEFRVKSFLQK